MIYRYTPICYFVTCLTLTILMMVTACSPGTPIEVTRVSQNIVATETVVPIIQEVDATSTRLIVVPTASPTITPASTLTPSPTNTAISSPTNSPLQKVAELPISTSRLYANLAISTDGALLAASNSAENVLYIFDMVEQTIKWRIIETESGGPGGYSSLAFSPDGHYLAAWDNGIEMFVSDMNSGEVIYRMKFDRDDEVNIRSASFSPDSQLLALSSFNNPVMIYSMDTGDLVDTLPSSNIVIYPPTDGGDHFLKPGHLVGDYWQVEFIPGYSKVLAISVDPYPFIEGESIVGGVYFWDMEAQSLANVILGEGGFAILVSPNGQLLVALVDNHLVGWDVVEGRELFVIEGIETDEYPISISETGFFATLSSSTGLKIWDFDGELAATLNPDKAISDTVFTPEGRLLIAYTGDDNPPIEVWEIHE